MGQTLLDLNDQLKQLFLLEDVDDEVIKDTADAIQGTIEEKLDGMAFVIDNLNMYAKTDREKAESWLNSARSREKKAKYLKSLIVEYMDDNHLIEVETANHKLRPRNYKASVLVTDESKIPADYVHTETVTKIDKKQLYSDLKAGNVPGAELKPNRGVVIK